MVNNEAARPRPATGRILIIDDEPQIRRFIDISLRAQGYATLQADRGGAGLALLARETVDLVILDLGLPDRDGQEVLRDLRRWSQVPVIVLTVRSGEAEKVALLDAGANDYVTKPFGIEEFMARVRVLLRAVVGEGEPVTVLDDGVLRIDLGQREVRVRGQPVALTRKEFALLAMLAREPGRIVTQTQLLREVWGPTHEDDTHYLRVLVGKLRQKLGDDAASPAYIVTEPGVGLRLLLTGPSATR